MFGSVIPASIPSPSSGSWSVGPLTIRAYGLLMALAMFVAGWITWARYRARGGDGDVALNATVWAIPFGLVGARLYHVVTTPYGYFGPGGDPWAVFKVWEGGMAIFGAVGFGALGAIISLRRDKQRVGPFADALAPGLLIAQAIGRFGNYFNQELYGSATTLPWGLEIDEAHLPSGYAVGTLFHPTFLYEAIWNVAMALLLIYLGRVIRFKSGQLMALYMVVYPLGRILMETMRMDEAKVLFGLRLNTVTSIVVLIAGVITFFICGKVGAPTRISPEEVDRFKAVVAQRSGKGKQTEVAGADTSSTEIVDVSVLDSGAETLPSSDGGEDEVDQAPGSQDKTG